jgi:phosphoglycerate dehydrogenase-like enzyme
MSEPLVVCLGYPELDEPEHIERVRAIDPGIEVVTLPVEPDKDWITVPPAEPHPEPPPWAEAFAEERRQALARAHVLLALHTPKDLPTQAPNLRWVQCVGAGVDQFAVAGLRRPALLTNASGLSSASMAEFVIGRILQIFKRFPEQGEYQRRHEYVQTYGRTFAGCTVGVVGLGAIGAAVGTRAKALGARVLGLKRSYEPGMTHPDADELFGMDDLHEMLSRCDVAVIAAPATDDTHHLVDAAALAAMPRGGILINVARGSLMDTEAFIDAMQRGHLSAAALDVFEQEPLPPESPLWELPNLLISAHSSVSTDRYAHDLFELFTDNLGRYIRGEPMRNLVDMDALGFG